MALFHEKNRLIGQLETVLSSSLLGQFWRDPNYEKVRGDFISGIGQALEAVMTLNPFPEQKREKDDEPKPEPKPKKPKKPKKHYMITFAPGGQKALIMGHSSVEANGKASDVARAHGLEQTGWDVVPVKADDIKGISFINLNDLEKGGESDD